PDGTRLLAYRIPISYGDWEGELPGKLLTMPRLKEPTHDLMAFYGVGDHGGGLTKLSIQSILDLAKQPGAPALLFSTPDRYFDEIRATGGLCPADCAKRFETPCRGLLHGQLRNKEKQPNRRDSLADGREICDAGRGRRRCSLSQDGVRCCLEKSPVPT